MDKNIDLEERHKAELINPASFNDDKVLNFF